MSTSIAIDRDMCVVELGRIEHKKIKSYTLQRVVIVVYRGSDHHLGGNNRGILKDDSYDRSAIGK